MNGRLCGQCARYSQNIIQVICLGEECKNRRMACQNCAFKLHFNHPTLNFHDSQVQILSQRKSEALKSFGKTIEKLVSSSFDKFLGESQKMTETIAKNRKEAEENVKVIVQSIIRSFLNLSQHFIIPDLKSEMSPSAEKVNTYAKILSFIYYYHQGSLKQLLEFCQEIPSYLDQPIKKVLSLVYHSLKILYKPLEASLKCSQMEEEQDYGNFLLSIMALPLKYNIEQILEDQKQQKIIQNIEPFVPPWKLDSNQASNTFQQRISNYMEEQALYLYQNQQMNYQNYQPYYSPNINHFGFPNYPYPGLGWNFGPQEHQQYQNSFYKQANFDQSKNAVEVAYNEPQIIQAYIKCNSTKELNEVLFKFNPTSIRYLQIKCDTALDFFDHSSVKLISKMEGLISLKIYLAYYLKSSMIMEMLRNMHKLQELVLAEFADLDQQFAYSLTENNPNLKRICFNNDTECNVNHEEMLEFFCDLPEGRRPEKCWQILTNSTLSLTNIQIQYGINIQYWTNYIKKASNYLKEVIISNPTDQNTVNYTPIIEALGKCSNLVSLRLQQVYFKHAVLAQVISNNSNLKALHISESLGSNIIHSELLSSPKLKYLFLCLVQPEKLSINCEYLETLVIRGCNTIKHQELSSIIQRSKRLSSLSLNSLKKCPNSQNIKFIADSLSIRYLSLSLNQMLKSHFSKLKQMNNLESFVCLGSNVSYRQIAKCTFAAKLKKLSVSAVEQNGVKEDLQIQILTKSFPKLTHLKIINYRGLQGNLEQFARMKYLVSVISNAFEKKRDTQILESYLESREIHYLYTQYIEQAQLSQYSYK